ncbi:hypothetical protein JCM10212_006673 [Sporobolomyces blumeae]
MQWAQQVVNLPSSSHPTAIKLSDLPDSPEFLACQWSALLRDPSTSESDKKLVLRGLRLARLSESHDLILRDVAELVDTDPSVRLQAAGTLLQYASMASSTVLRDASTRIVAKIARALSLLRATVPSESAPSSTNRFVATCFRILKLFPLKIASLPPDVTDSIATLTGHWVYHGSRHSLGMASPAPRGRTGVSQDQLAFGVMSAFAQSMISPRKSGKARETSSSSPSTGRDSASESESDDPRRDRRSESAQIRLDALACLSSLATNNPKALHRHWHLFLRDSPYLRDRPTLIGLIEHDPTPEVRIQACLALESLLADSSPYLALAQDRPRTASFTSLSTKIGETVSELHMSVVSLLQKPLGQHPLAGEIRRRVLALARQLAECSPYGRMSRSLAGPLADAALSNVEFEGLVIPSLEVVSAVLERRHSTSSAQPLDSSGIIASARRILRDEVDQGIQAAVWRVLAACVSLEPDQDWSIEFDDLEVPSSTVATAKTRFLVSFFAPSVATAAANVRARLDPLFSKALQHVDRSVRLEACSALARPTLTASDQLDPLAHAARLISDSDEQVADAACRIVGVRVRDEGIASEHFSDAFEALLERFDRGAAEKVGDASWALANCCDILADGDISEVELDRLIRRATAIVVEAFSGDESVCISCLRILGATTKLASSSTAAGLGSVFATAMTVATSAKIRWNACTALTSALESPDFATSDVEVDLNLLERLTTIARSDPSYKVRIHAVAALTSLISREERRRRVATSHERGLLDGVREAKTELELALERNEVQVKERRHVEVLVKKLANLSDLLSSSLASVSPELSAQAL